MTLVCAITYDDGVERVLFCYRIISIGGCPTKDPSVLLLSYSDLVYSAGGF
jgi:hypothetical protein